MRAVFAMNVIPKRISSDGLRLPGHTPRGAVGKSAAVGGRSSAGACLPFEDHRARDRHGHGLAPRLHASEREGQEEEDDHGEVPELEVCDLSRDRCGLELKTGGL